jgi:CRP-like cAMP-binding protein
MSSTAAARSQKNVRGRRRHQTTNMMKHLASISLAQKIGYLTIEKVPSPEFFDSLSHQSFSAERLIRSKGRLCLVKAGSVTIKSPTFGTLVTTLPPGVIFGDMALLGLTMLGTEAAAGPQGAKVISLDEKAARRWVDTDPAAFIELIGPRLSLVEVEHYRSRFQLSDSRVAALFLSLAGDGIVVDGYTHRDIGEMIGTYRETVTTCIDVMKRDGLIEVGRRRITILDKTALRKLAEL